MLRTETDADLAFLRALYASTRAAELAPTAWSPAEKRRFTDDQFELQRGQYRANYADAEWLVIEAEGQTLGRLYLHAGAREARLIDIALLPAAQGRGLGTRLTRALLAWADARDICVSLHVEPFNPAYRLYVREGFAYERTHGYYHLLQRRPGAAAPAVPMSSRWPLS